MAGLGPTDLAFAQLHHAAAAETLGLGHEALARRLRLEQSEVRPGADLW